ncbi:S9 family peptidase [Natrinema salsiterrestre]|uniref:Acyl-peptide hydrolase n=1 Tax=Natrinema salsiterrestre TaxID=2950540 RepID=A0A9Q4KYA8_9EURY|nr:prolyl oligopeptidase family serine peptidase [Natrinema salsiterrestre]MDF9744081.1 prolyl oligopeptidase family serine peptidase [Natrinema salsiterrestre]
MDAYPIDRHLRVRVITGAQYGPDDALYFKCDLTGTHEIWRVTTPGTWPDQITFTGGNVTFASWSPTGEEMAFGVAEGGKRVQLHVQERGSKQVSKLTDDPETTHRWGGWNRDGSRFAYAADRAEPGRFNVYTQGRAAETAEARCVYEQERSSPVYPIGWGPGNERLLVLEMHSNYNADIHVVDLRDGDARRLTDGPDVEARYSSIRWGPDGEALYLITDHEYEWRYIARLDLSSGEVVPVIQEDADLKDLVLHSGRRRLAYRRSERGFSTISIRELTGPTETQPLCNPDMELGAAKCLTMRSDGDELGLMYTTPERKPDLYSIDVATGESVQWTDASEPVPNDTFVRPEPVTYESFDGLEIPSLYAEPTTRTDDGYPAIISLHAGPRQHNSPAFSPLRQYYLEQGFARIEPDYRGSSGYGKGYMELDDFEKRVDAIRDVKAAADWLAAKETVDEDRIVLKGRSYGGFLVLAAMTRWPERFGAGAAIAPIANFETYLENSPPGRQENREAEYGSLDEDRELLRELSPIHDIDQLEAPLLLAHGKDDQKVPFAEATELAEEARHHDIEISTLFLDGTGHSFTSRAARIELFNHTAAFFSEHS